MSRILTVAYELNPPAPAIPPSGLDRSRTLSLPVSAAGNREGETTKYYDALRAVIAQAKDTVGDDFTAWRDAVGNLEQSKEPKTGEKGDEEGEGEEGEE